MTSAIPGFTPTTPPTPTQTASGLNSMSPTDFLNLMIQQLQQQDPLNPTDSNQLLTQISEISTLQSNNSMEQSLTGLTLQQSIGAGGNLIGKSVIGLDSNGNNLSGLVTGVQVANNVVSLQINGNSTDTMPLSNVEQIANLGTTPVGSTGTTGTGTTGTGTTGAGTVPGTTTPNNSTSNTNATLTQLANILASMAG